MSLKVDQRPFKTALRRAIDDAQVRGHLDPSFHQFDRDFYEAVETTDNYVRVDGVWRALRGFMAEGRYERAMKFVDNIPDETDSRLTLFLYMAALVVLVLAIGVGAVSLLRCGGAL